MVSKDKTSRLLSTGGGKLKPLPRLIFMGRQQAAFAYACVCGWVCVGWGTGWANDRCYLFPFSTRVRGSWARVGVWQVSRNQRPSSDLPFSYTCESSNAFAIRQQRGKRETSQTYIIVWPKRWDRIAVEMQCILYVQSRAPNPQRSNLPSLSDLWCYLDFTWFVFNVRVQRAKIEKNGAQ